MVQEHAGRIKAGVQDGGADWRVAKAITEAFVARRIGEVVEQAEKELSPRSATVLVALMRLVSNFTLFHRHLSYDTLYSSTFSVL